jgi:hypothetical protein
MLLVLAPVTAHAAPCDSIKGPAHKYCMQGQKQKKDGEDASLPETDFAPGSDPLSSLAKGISQTAAWTVDKLSDAVAATANVDFTNPKFLQTYAIVFAASTFLVLLLWLWAVAKRAVRGVPLTTAIGEAIGLLWLTVLVTAFTPLILYTVVSAVDGLTEALGGGKENTKFFAAFSKALEDDSTDGGPFAQIGLSLVSIIAAGVVWLELVVRSALLYVGAVLGTVVYAGLVDKELWSRVKKWVGIMSAVILVKPIIVIVLALASAMADGGKPEDTTASIISGLAIIIIAIVASALLFRMIPGMGDEIVAARRDSYDPASRQSAAVVTRPIQGIKQGITTHAARDVASRPAAQPAMSSPSSGISAHSTRPSGGGSVQAAPPRPARQDVPRQDNRGGDSNGR